MNSRSSRSGLFLIRRLPARGEKKASISIVAAGRHVVAPATAEQIRTALGVTDTDMEIVRKIMAKYSPLPRPKKKARAAD